MTRYVVVTGGVVSGLGKGITASTIALLLNTHGYSIDIIKIDPYINVDSGTMSPFEHGECYVLEDGSETDLDLGNYERFLNTNLSHLNSITTGQIYRQVIENERAGKYLGKTVQVVPHITNEILRRLTHLTTQCDGRGDFCIVELGGTVGDIESSIYLEAIRQLAMTSQVYHVHVTLVLDIGDEEKTKPAQTSMQTLMSKGIFPDMLVVRCKHTVNQGTINKLSMFSNVPKTKIVQNVDCENIYMVPQMFLEQKVDLTVLNEFSLEPVQSIRAPIGAYNRMTRLLSGNKLGEIVKVAIVGKYTGSNDTYLSIVRAVEHASFKLNVKPVICFLDEDLTKLNPENIDAIIIPGGFGYRGCEKKIEAIGIAHEKNIPILGICLGFQLMLLYAFRKLLSYPGAYHAEWEEDIVVEESNDRFCPIDKMTAVYEDEMALGLGGSMRLGAHEIIVESGTIAHRLYEKNHIIERHRHRYGLSERYKHMLSSANIILSGHSKETEIIEASNKTFFLGCQFHPEMQSRLENPHPLFTELLSSVWYA